MFTLHMHISIVRVWFSCFFFHNLKTKSVSDSSHVVIFTKILKYLYLTLFILTLYVQISILIARWLNIFP